MRLSALFKEFSLRERGTIAVMRSSIIIQICCAVTEFASHASVVPSRWSRID